MEESAESFAPPESSAAAGSGAQKDANEAPLILPELQDTTLDEAQLRVLLSDIATYGEVSDVSVKGAARAKAEKVENLSDLYLLLLDRRIFGAQIRYKFSGQRWLDTLMATSTGVRLVRAPQEF